MDNRIGWIDTAKGIGIFLVVLGHMLPPVGIVPTLIWTFHMPLFFFLSGFTARATTKGQVVPTIRGLRSIAIPYLFFSLLSISIWAGASQNLWSSDTWSSELRQMLFGVSGPDGLMRYNVPLWFLTCLLSVKLLFAALTVITQSRVHQITAAVFVALMAHVFVFPHLAPMVWNLDVALSALAFFVTGYALKGYKMSPAISPTRVYRAGVIIALILYCAAAYFNGRIDMNGRDFGNPLVFYIGAFAGIGLTLVVSVQLARFSVLKKVGRASIVIFSLHALFWLIPSSIMSIPRWYAFRITHSDLLSYVVMTLIEVALCAPIYFLMLRWVPVLLGQFPRKSLSKQSDPLAKVGA